MHQLWYKINYPKSSDKDWKCTQHDHWIEHHDESEHPQLWKEICALWEEPSTNADESTKKLYSHVMAIRDDFAHSCQTYSRLEDVHIGGFVLYTSTEEAGQQAAGVFAGSQLILDIVNEKQADLKALIDYLTTIVKYQCLDKNAAVPSFTKNKAGKSDLACEKGETMRDRNHRVAPLMMVEKFDAVGVPHEGKNFLWKNTLNLLYTHQIQVVDWPAGVLPIGADFVFKDLKTDELKALVAPYLKSCMGMEYYHEIAHIKHQDVRKRGGGVEIPGRELSLRPWSDESKETFINEDPETLDIPLITDTKGKVLRILMDSSMFMKNLPPALTLPDPSTPHQYSLSPPLSPMSWSMAPPDDYDQSHRLSPIPPHQPASRSWSSSQPHHDHRQNFHPAPTRIPPRQLAIAHTNLHKVQAVQTSRKWR
ncbi:hypothetical protein BDR04DRAFT_1153462 [Suillus decipiens]|nr:hypothetical protein BDR04DRAFT_1153462 [Suillus decipiens]